MVSAEEAAATSEAESSDRGQIARAAAIIMAGTIISRLLGLGREQISSWLFGTGDPIAAFTIADNIQTILYNLVMSGMMEAALVPVLAAYAVPELRQELRRIVGALLVLALIVIGGAVLLMEIFAPAVVVVMTAIGGDPGAHGAATLSLTLTLVRMILPAVLLLALSTVLMSTLYALHRFARPAMSLAVRNAAVVVTALVLGGTAFGVRSLALGLVIGSALLFALMLPGLRDALPRPNLDFRHPAIRRILALYLPIAIGLVSNTIALVIDRNLAWSAGPNALGGMRYATTLNQLILGIVAAATSLAALPTLSRHFNNGDEDAYQRTLSNGLKMVTVMVVPATFGMAAIAWPTVDLLFFHGATTLAGAQAILVALLGYLPGTFFAAFDQVLIFGYYARQNTRKPVVVGVIAVGVYLAVALPLVHPLGMLGLVLANSAQFTFHALAMWWLMHRDLGRVGDATVGRTIRVASLVGLAMGAVVFVLAKVLEGAPLGAFQATPSGDPLRRLVVVALPAAVGAVVYLGGLHLFGVDEIRAIQRGVTRRLGRAAR